MNRRRLPVLGVVFSLVIAAQSAGADDLVRRVEEAVRRVQPWVVQQRRDFHAHPELSNREERTARTVAEHLRAMGVTELRCGVARNGVVALIRGLRSGPTVALRADMDALPIQERTGLSFASRTPNVMHACGHDTHTAMLLGAAKVLLGLRDAMPGSVKLIFQPAEEGCPPGERGGAAVMIEQGVLREPEVAAVFGLHVAPDLDTGRIGCRTGSVMASVDRFRVTVRGKQSHGAMPWQGIDPVVTAAQVILALQTIVSRKIDAREPAVVTVGTVHGGRAWNIIPESVELEGTIRTLNPQVRRAVEAQFRQIVAHTAAAQGATATITAFEDYAPVVWNDPGLVRRIRPALERAFGSQNVVEPPPMMGGEDFARYAEKVPGVFLLLGVRNAKIGAVGQLHTPNLVIDEAALPLGVKTLALLALEFLAGAGGGVTR
jgi:amidohydrolase